MRYHAGTRLRTIAPDAHMEHLLSGWMAPHIDAAVPDDANYVGCVCVRADERYGLVEPMAHFRGVSATFPKVKRRQGERGVAALQRCIDEKLGVEPYTLYPLDGVWSGVGVKATFFLCVPTDRAARPPSSPHVAAVHWCTRDEAIARLVASGNGEDQSRDFALLALASATPRTPARRLLLMVRALHRMGFELLRPRCGLSPSGVHWRFELTTTASRFPVSMEPSRTTPRPSPLEHWDYSSAQGQRLLGRDDLCFATPEELALVILQHAPRLAYMGLGSDPAYVRWYASMLADSEPEGTYIEYADFDLPTDHLPVGRARLPLPPPSLAEATVPVVVPLIARPEDGCRFARLDDPKLARAWSWRMRVKADPSLSASMSDLPRFAKIASWRDIGGVVASPSPGVGLVARSVRKATAASGEHWFDLALPASAWTAIIAEGTVAVYLPSPWSVEACEVELVAMTPP